MSRFRFDAFRIQLVRSGRPIGGPPCWSSGPVEAPGDFTLLDDQDLDAFPERLHNTRYDIYHRAGKVLSHFATLTAEETLTSPLLPEFAQLVAEVFLPKEL